MTSEATTQAGMHTMSFFGHLLYIPKDTVVSVQAIYGSPFVFFSKRRTFACGKVIITVKLEHSYFERNFSHTLAFSYKMVKEVRPESDGQISKKDLAFYESELRLIVLSSKQLILDLYLSGSIDEAAVRRLYKKSKTLEQMQTY